MTAAAARTNRLLLGPATLVSLTPLFGTAGCIRCNQETKSFPALLREATAAVPRTIDASITRQSIDRTGRDCLTFRYEVNDSAVATVRNSGGANLQQTAAKLMHSDPLAVTATSHQIEIEHIFTDKVGSLLLALVCEDSAEAASLPTQIKTSSTGVQTNPFLK